MMRTISATDLKAHVSAILGDVERGETITITRHGKVVARLTPGRQDATQSTIGARIEEFRRSLPRTGITVEDILEMRDEGRERR
jgi:prevent-host-death family protein